MPAALELDLTVGRLGCKSKGQMKNVYPYSNGWQMRLMVDSQYIIDVGYETPEKAGFVADLCKAILIEGFHVPLKRTEYSLDRDYFRNRCLDAGLDPEDPLSFLSHPNLPQQFREYVELNRSQWLRDYGPKSVEEQAAEQDIRSVDARLRAWAVKRKILAARLKHFSSQPRGWWSNLFKGLKGKSDDAYAVVAVQLSPSLRSHLSNDPKLITHLSKISETASALRLEITELEKLVNDSYESAEAELSEHDKNKPTFDPTRKFWQDDVT